LACRFYSFVDTPGAYPGIDAEERGQSEAIGRNLAVMAELKVPLIATIIGEGGSGGALAIAVADIVAMLQYSTYSVISPEGCASILWKSAERAGDAAETMGITAHRLKSLGLVDKVINEPVGGAHRDYRGMAQNVKKALQESTEAAFRTFIQRTHRAPFRSFDELWPIQGTGDQLIQSCRPWTPASLAMCEVPKHLWSPILVASTQQFCFMQRVRRLRAPQSDSAQFTLITA
jgi:hypothetical protein